MERLEGKTAMVVGAGSIGPGWGNGKATAVTFAREGAQVFCVDRNAAAAQETVDRLDPPPRHFLRHLWRLEGGDEPDDADHRRAVRAGPCPRQLHPARPDEDADG